MNKVRDHVNGVNIRHLGLSVVARELGLESPLVCCGRFQCNSVS